MKGSKLFEKYEGVPRGSKLVTKVTGNPGEWEVRLEITDGVTVVDIKESLLVLGWELPLPGATSLFATWYTAFLAESNLAIRAEIRRPDGSMFSQATEWTVAGIAGSVPQRGLYIQTA